MDIEKIEGELAGLHARGPRPELRGRVLGRARGEWLERAEAGVVFWRFMRGLAIAMAASVLLCATIFWREESATAQCFLREGVAGDESERMLRAMCAEVGLNQDYAARWALVSRDLRESRNDLAALWRELAIQ